MKFTLRLFDASTRALREVEVEALSQQEAVLRAPGAPWMVLSAKAHRDVWPVPVRPFGERLDVSWWCRELRTLLGAGMTVVEAIETMASQPLGNMRARLHGALLGNLQQGQPLSQAMRATGQFPLVLIAGISSGERTSELVPALNEYLRFHDLLDGLRRKTVSAAIYPAIVATLGVVISVFLLLYVLPRFSAMYAGLAGPISPTTRFVIELSRVFATQGHWIALGLCGLLGLLVVAWRAGWINRGAEQVSEAWPPLRRRIDEFRLAKLFQCLALMFRGGYAFDEAVNQAQALELGKRMTQALTTANTALRSGQRVSTALKAAGLADPVSFRLLAVGERTGNFEVVLTTIAERHALNFATLLERTTRVVEPLLMLIVSMAVGGIVLLMYMPVFDIAAAIR